MRNRELIIFDLDDTLINTSEVYWRARTAFIHELACDGIGPDGVVEEFENIDSEHMLTLQFSPERYGKSMLATYRRLLNQLDRPASENAMSRIRSLGNYVLEHLPKPIEGASELLHWAGDHFQLALLTRGDNELQRKKLRQAGFSKHFDYVQVVTQKDYKAFGRVLTSLGYPAEKAWVVGDSIKSDINPGQSVGAKCILYWYFHPYYRWSQDCGGSSIGHFYKAMTLREVKRILERPNAFRQVNTLTDCPTILNRCHE